jgi:hypothetical protein
MKKSPKPRDRMLEHKIKTLRGLRNKLAGAKRNPCECVPLGSIYSGERCRRCMEVQGLENRIWNLVEVF